MFAMWTSTTVPVRVRGSREALSRCSASTGGYSTPWVPAMSASTGPGFDPLMTVTGMTVPSSPGPAGTFNSPDASVPGAAVTPPMTKGACAWAAHAAVSRKISATGPNTRGVQRNIV